MENTFFNFKLDLEPNIIDMMYDLLRMSTIQLITQIMFYMNNSSLSLFNETFIKTFVFINISIVFYYLVVRKIFSFISDDYLNKYLNNDKPSYAGTPPIGSSSNINKTSLNTGIIKPVIKPVINSVNNSAINSSINSAINSSINSVNSVNNSVNNSANNSVNNSSNTNMLNIPVLNTPV